jgi:phosphoglycolate phosphatase-like HAD superfamily hydrolase
MSDTEIVSPVGHSLIIFDWDDTLLPTTWLLRKGLLPGSVLSTGVMEMFEELSLQIIRVIEYAQTFGRVVIITNSEKGWVPECAGAFMPKIVPTLKKIDIYSARNEKLPAEAWKKKAFKREMYKTYGRSDLQRNVVSIGDSLHERLAVASVKGPTTYAKNILLLPTPEPHILIQELKSLIHFMTQVVLFRGDTDLVLEADGIAHPPD